MFCKVHLFFVEKFFKILPQSTKKFGQGVLRFSGKVIPHACGIGEENEEHDRDYSGGRMWKYDRKA